jgi:hypothetical protein
MPGPEKTAFNQARLPFLFYLAPEPPAYCHLLLHFLDHSLGAVNHAEIVMGIGIIGP